MKYSLLLFLTSGMVSCNNERNLAESLSNRDTCGDSTSLPCYQCLENPKNRYCKYTKAFSRYICCHEDDSDPMCNSKDSDIECSDSY